MLIPVQTQASLTDDYKTAAPPNLPFNLAQKPVPLRVCVPGLDIPQFVSRLSAGFPSPATDYMEEVLDLNTFLVRHKAATFAFAVKGNSMCDAGIVDGDKVLVDRSIRPRHGQIVVAVVNGDYTIKRLHLVAGCVELHAENAQFPPYKFQEGESFEVWGVVVGVVRRYGF